MSNSATTAKSKRIFLLCAAAYGISYFARKNMPIAITSLSQNLDIDDRIVGVIMSAYFWAYALGQISGGILGDKLPPKYPILLGLSLSAVLNLSIALCTNQYLIAVLWGLNGFALSFLWGSIIKILSAYFANRHLSTVAVVLNIFIILGFLMAWGVLGAIVNRSSWRYAFLIPALVIIVFLPIWLKFCPREITHQNSNPKNIDTPTTKTTVRTRRMLYALMPIMLVCAMHGAIKDGAESWAPDIINGLSPNPSTASALALIIPLSSIIGVVSAGFINKLAKNEFLTVIIFLLAAVPCCLALNALENSAASTTALLSLTVALMYGANTMLTSAIPLKNTDRASTAAGFADFATYSGSAIASQFIGVFRQNLNTVYTFWSILAITAVIVTVIIFWAQRSSQKKGSL